MIRIVQYLCPLRHCIVALAYRGEAKDAPTMSASLGAWFADGIAKGAIDPFCGICGSRDLHFEDDATRFSTMEEAQPELARLELENQRARLALGFSGSRN